MANVLTANQADCGDTLGTVEGWWASGDEATVSSSTAAYHSSPRSVLCTATGTVAVFVRSDQTGLTGWPCVPNDPVVASGWVRRAAGTTAGEAFYVVVNWYNSSGTWIAESPGSQQTPSTTEWVQSTLSTTAPASAAYADMQLAVWGSITNGAGFHWDDIACDLGASSGTTAVTYSRRLVIG